jgi:hypothetical protein
VKSTLPSSVAVIALAVLFLLPSESRTQPLVDHHQHFFNPGIDAAQLIAVYGISLRGHAVVGATTAEGAAGIVGATNGVAGTSAGAFFGQVFVSGDFTVAGGAKSAAVPHPDGTHRRLYCLESPESWFEDCHMVSPA